MARRTYSEAREKHKELTRSSKWRQAREKHLDDNPYCAACGSHKRAQVHHVRPFHLHPELELDPSNFITLCMDVNECHLRIGHGDSFQAYNPNVREDAEKFKSASAVVRGTILEAAKASRKIE